MTAIPSWRQEFRDCAGANFPDHIMQLWARQAVEKSPGGLTDADESSFTRPVVVGRLAASRSIPSTPDVRDGSGPASAGVYIPGKGSNAAKFPKALGPAATGRSGNEIDVNDCAAVHDGDEPRMESGREPGQKTT